MRKYGYIVISLVLFLASCANRGQGPQGGPRDTIPPLVVEETPLNGTLLFKAKEIVVHFDEYIQDLRRTFRNRTVIKSEIDYF